MSVQRLRLADGLRAPSQARAWLATRLPPLSRTTAEDALLLVSELVTNAVRHGAPEVVVGVVISDAVLRIEVHDDGEALPTVPTTQPSIDRPTGRGLLIVAATAHDWGIERRGGARGKTVWAELRRTPSTSPKFP